MTEKHEGKVTEDRPATLDDVCRELRGLRAAIACKQAELLPASRAAEFLGVGRSTLYRLMAAEPLLKPVRLPAGKRWRRADLQKYVDGLRK